MFDDKVVLLTGGTGSFGHKFTEIVLDKYRPKKFIIFSRDELKQFEMAKRFNGSKYDNIRFFIGDVRDRDRLYRAFNGVDYVIHAAAMKQVPIAEYNPFEAVKTNILGAQNVIDAAIDMKVKKVIALSTDKAVNPVNLYGATKLCSDKLFVDGNSYSPGLETIFSVVRYGNVVGSRGSVIPFFLKQKDTGVFTITDPRMTRFWIDIESGCEFVLDCFRNMTGGELFIPKVPSMSIMDLAKTIDSTCKTEIVGIRPGEKLHEILLSSDDARNTLECDKYYVILKNNKVLLKRISENKGVAVDEGFEYSSKTNSWFMSEAEMRELISRYKQNV